MEHHLRKGHQFLLTRIFILASPERADAGIGRFDVFFLFQVGEVFSITDSHPVIGSSFPVKDDIETVELPFPAVNIDKGSCLPEEEGA